MPPPPLPLPPHLILTLDLDCFYASVALRTRPHLHQSPVAIVQKHLCVTTNYVARRWNIPKMTPVSVAKARCPDIVLIDGSDLTPFRQASAEVMQAVRAFLAKESGNVGEIALGNDVPVQRLGLDELFIDITTLIDAQLSSHTPSVHCRFDGHITGTCLDPNLRLRLMLASQLASNLRQHISQATSLTTCAGVSVNKTLAKLAVNMHKPNDQTVFLPDNAAIYVAQLAPTMLLGFGRATLEAIRKWCGGGRKVDTVADVLALFPPYDQTARNSLVHICRSKHVADALLEMCQGRDNAPVVDSGDAPRSITAEDSCRDCWTYDEVVSRIKVQTTRLVSRLRADAVSHSRHARTLTVSYRFRGEGYARTTRAVSMPQEVASLGGAKMDSAEEKAVQAVAKAALKVLREAAGVYKGERFCLTLLAVGAKAFSDHAQRTRDSSLGDIAKFFEKPSGKRRLLVHEGLAMNNASRDSEKQEQVVDVQCPICNKRLSGGNDIVNRHVDLCLDDDGNKRKKRRKKAGKSTMTLDGFFGKVQP